MAVDPHVWRWAYRAHHVTTGELTVNTGHVVDGGDGGVFASESAVATALNTAWNTLWKNMLASSDLVDDFTVTKVTDPLVSPTQAVIADGASGNRTVSDTDISRAICAVLSLKTAVPKRYARGHQFLPPAIGSATIATGATFATGNAYWTACTAWATAMHTAVTYGGAGNLYPCVFSKTAALKGVSPNSFVVSAAVLNNVQHFLRSRWAAGP